MIVDCPSCGATYNISDDKVRGRRVRVRCKNCSGPIIVDGETLDADDGALPGFDRAGLVRSVQTPDFEGITFHEVLCKSALNKTPEASNLPFRYTVNTFRGCSHACRYCFARPTHEYLDLDPGHDFDTQLVVKTNVAAVLRRELSRKSWKR